MPLTSGESEDESSVEPTRSVKRMVMFSVCAMSPPSTSEFLGKRVSHAEVRDQGQIIRGLTELSTP